MKLYLHISVSAVAFLIASLVGMSKSAAYGDGVVKYAVDELKGNLDIMDVLRHMSQPAAKLGKYQFINCDKDGDLLNVTKLNFTPDPVVFPGPLGIDLSGVIKTTVDAPLKAEVLIERKVGSAWIKIPCIGLIGSCVYHDLCDMLTGPCPQPLVDNNIPCMCPFDAGSYTLNNMQLAVQSAVFPPGDYHGKATLVTGEDGGTSVGCVELYATFG